MRHIINGERLAIRVDERTLLAVPPIRPGTTRDQRVLIFECVLRRQPTLAALIASGGLEPPPARTYTDVIAGFIHHRPHSGGWRGDRAA